jgi:integrase
MAGRRGKSEGSIRKRADDRWEARYVDAAGKRQSIYGNTRQEVARLLNAAIRDRELGITALSARQTVGDYLTSWMAIYKQRRRLTSYERNERTVRRHLIPGLGSKVLAKLTPQEIEVFYTRKLADGTSAFTVRMCHKVLRQALNDALRLGLVHRNVVALVKPPRARSREMAFYTEEQVRTLLAAASGNRQEALIILALATGMREGELLALKWDDLDFENASILVRATAVRTREGKFREEVKTGHSRRRIALPSIAVEALRRHRARQAEERLRLGTAWEDNNLVFPNMVGRIYDADNWRFAKFYPLLERAGLPRIRPHDLRHTAATLLLARGVPVKVVSEMLGHANVGITLSIYGHVLPHMQQQAVSTMDDMLRGLGDMQGSNQGSKTATSDHPQGNEPHAVP